MDHSKSISPEYYGAIRQLQFVALGHKSLSQVSQEQDVDYKVLRGFYDECFVDLEIILSASKGENGALITRLTLAKGKLESIIQKELFV